MNISNISLIIITSVVVLLSFGSNVVIAREWSTEEAKRAFGEESDTVSPTLIRTSKQPDVKKQDIKNKTQIKKVNNRPAQVEHIAANTSNDVISIADIISKYGKSSVVDYIRMKRHNIITINNNGIIEEYIGAPDEQYVNLTTIQRDLNILNTTPKEAMFEWTKIKQNENVSLKQQLKQQQALVKMQNEEKAEKERLERYDQYQTEKYAQKDSEKLKSIWIVTDKCQDKARVDSMRGQPGSHQRVEWDRLDPCEQFRDEVVVRRKIRVKETVTGTLTIN